MMNISKSRTKDLAKDIAFLLRVLGQPERLSILLVIGNGEACVCHLEAALGLRQAYISQHLMALRDADIVIARREGRNIFYRLKNPQALDLIQLAGGLAGATSAEINSGIQSTGMLNCPCPHCTPKDELQHDLEVHKYSR
jgi:ArsR family transcriptional regulator